MWTVRLCSSCSLGLSLALSLCRLHRSSSPCLARLSCSCSSASVLLCWAVLWGASCVAPRGVALGAPSPWSPFRLALLLALRAVPLLRSSPSGSSCGWCVAVLVPRCCLCPASVGALCRRRCALRLARPRVFPRRLARLARLVALSTGRASPRLALASPLAGISRCTVCGGCGCGCAGIDAGWPLLLGSPCAAAVGAGSVLRAHPKE